MAKKTTKKSMFWIFILIAFILIGGGAFVYMNFANFAKQSMEKIATNALGVPVKISRLDMSLQDKSITVSGIKISNPPGYKAKNAVEVGSVSVALKNISENVDLVHFASVDVRSTIVNLEVGNGSTNLQDLQKTMAKKPKAQKIIKQPKVMLDRFHIDRSQLNPSVTLIGADLSPVKVPPVTLKGIGKKEKGVLAKEAIIQVVQQYIGVASRQAEKSGYLKGVSSAGIDNVKQEIDREIDSVKDTIDSFEKSVGGLFGN